MSSMLNPQQYRYPFFFAGFRNARNIPFGIGTVLAVDLDDIATRIGNGLMHLIRG